MAERRTRRTRAARLRPLLPLAGIWFAGVALLVVLALQREVPYDQLLLDPNSVNKAPWYTGLVSNLGILGWTTATAAAFFGAGVARYGGRPAAATLLHRGALLSTILLFDDLFQLHVALKPLFGVSKSVVYLGYVLVAAWWVATQYREIRRTRMELLLAAGAAFALSVLFDQFGPSLPRLSDQAVLLLEDAAKFLGVLAWAQYFSLTASDIMRSIVNELRAAAAAPVESSPPEPRDYDERTVDAGPQSVRAPLR